MLARPMLTDTALHGNPAHTATFFPAMARWATKSVRSGSADCVFMRVALAPCSAFFVSRDLMRASSALTLTAGSNRRRAGASLR
jgi:hypothetical protein